jgi:dihydrolipoamide dehydrogenase
MARIGVEVTIIEYFDSLIPTMDKELGKELKKIFTKQNIKILLSHKVQSAKNNGKNATVTFLILQTPHKKSLPIIAWLL